MASLSELDLIKASQLEELTEVTDSNYVVVTDGATSKKVKATNLKGNSLTSEQAQQLSEAYEHSQTPHVSADDILTNQDISGLQPKTDNNLATTSKEVVGAINEVKSLNDTKLDKTDANKLNSVSIDNVSLKEYILTNLTGTEKTYYLIAKTTCTDLPKASNFFITVETPGMYTYKVTAKELNDGNGIYVCTYRSISSTWTEWEKVCTTKVVDTTIDSMTSISSNATINIFKCIAKNGYCTITLGLTINSVAPTFEVIAEGLPRPYAQYYCSPIYNWSDVSEADTSSPLHVCLDTSGNLKVEMGVANKQYYVSFSYIVAE